jgi:hypothetical protein
MATLAYEDVAICKIVTFQDVTDVNNCYLRHYKRNVIHNWPEIAEKYNPATRLDEVYDKNILDNIKHAIAFAFGTCT